MVRLTSIAAFAAVLGLSLASPVVRLLASPELFPYLEATPGAPSRTPEPSRTPGASRIPRGSAGVTPGASFVPMPAGGASAASSAPVASNAPQLVTGTQVPGIVNETPGPVTNSQANQAPMTTGPTSGDRSPTSAASLSPVADTGAVPNTGSIGSATIPTPFVFPEASPIDGPSPQPTPTPAVCFPAHSTVELENGSRKTMEQVQLGDRVKVADGVFSDVFMFTHKLSEVVHEFVSIKTTSGGALSLTEGHYLYVNGDLSPARVVKSGDVLELGNGSKTTVTTVETLTARGLFNPQTTHGDIVVDGVKSSTYTTAVTPGAAHALLAPVRSLYERLGFTTDILDAGSARLASMIAGGLSS